MKLWTTAEVEEVVGESTAALARTVHRLRTHYTEPAEDTVAWGQYLDDEHSTGEQWGLYGTAAATQVLALHFARAGEQASAQPLVAGALGLLPEDIDNGHPLLEEKRQKGDFDNVLKLAAIAEALRPDAEHIPADVEPPIVTRLRTLALEEGGWTTRPAGSAQREVRERDLATAYVLYGFRRYELGDVGLRARRWLARRVVDDAPIRGFDLLALVGLALTAHPLHPADPPPVGQAIGHVEDRLRAWARSRDTARVDRPLFNGFSVGATTDYLFLHPEILAAFYFLGRGHPHETRPFVVSVASAVAANIATNDGLMVANGIIATVDQVWAYRLLLAFRTRHQDQGLEEVAPKADEGAVREMARQHTRRAAAEARKAVRLWSSREAGYLRRFGHGLLVLVPIVLALLAALLLFEKTAEAVGSVVIGVLIAIGIGYFFFFKESDRT